MKSSRSSGLAVCSVLLVIALLVLPVSGAATVATTPSADASATSGRGFVSATGAAYSIGEPVYISGVSVGSNKSIGVQIWVFAGNYVNITTVPVKADESFLSTYDTTGLPPATYNVIVQSPGPDGLFGVSMQPSGQHAGEVVNTRTGTTIFNFTGTGSVHDAAAAAALSDAINKQSGDDLYTKLSFVLPSPATADVKAVSTAATRTAAPVATKSPLPMELTGVSLVIVALGAVLFNRK